VTIVDADCVVGDFAIDNLARLSGETNRPVQALYVMEAAPGSAPRAPIREFAWRVRNRIRPLGLNAAGLPCQLMGTGMAFPWEIIANAALATGELAEDLKLGLELAAKGRPPVFCPTAIVSSEFPATREGSQTQQLRWEQGHLGLITREIPKLLVKALRSRNLELLALTIDAAIPPLSFLFVITTCLFAVGLLLRDSPPFGRAIFSISAGSLIGYTCAAFLCWLSVGRDLIPMRSALLIPISVFLKIPFYYRILLRKNGSTWVRTDRRRM
jgi:cellulose synthase/poly-beta-1,6-N-acetylglucosamine synthase-like glycosyltransferase